MPTIRAIDPSFAVGFLTGSPTTEYMTPEQCRQVCLDRGLVALVTGDEDERFGFAVAESDHESVRFLLLDGDVEMCGLLLDRLERLAGERDVSGWCPADREDVRWLLEKRGFERRYRDDFKGVQCYLYHCNRNESEG